MRTSAWTRALVAVTAASITLLAIACGGGDGSSTPTRASGTSSATTVAASPTTMPPDASTATVRSEATPTAARATDLPATVVPSPDATQPPFPSKSAATICASAAPDTVTGTLQSPAMNETSGLAISSKHPGVIWGHNDSGDTARFFAIDQSGALLATYNLPGITAVDWEDMAIGGGTGLGYLYLGDIGDNLSVRPDIVVYRVLMPDPAADGPGDHDVTSTDIHLTYPDKPHDAETLMIDPTNDDLVIITKDISGGPSGVFVLHGAAIADGTNMLEKVGEIPFSAFTPQKLVPAGSPPLPSALPKVPTSGDISPAGDVILVRTYGTVWAWSRDAGQSLAAALAAPPCEGPSAIEPQGEAIAFDPDGGGYWTTSEGAGAALHHFRWK
jgi:hypothetical protein